MASALDKIFSYEDKPHPNLKEEFSRACAADSFLLGMGRFSYNLAEEMVVKSIVNNAPDEKNARQINDVLTKIDPDIIGGLLNREEYKPLKQLYDNMGGRYADLFEGMTENPKILALTREAMEEKLKRPRDIRLEDQFDRQTRLVREMMCDPKTRESMFTLITPYEETQKTLELQDKFMQEAIKLKAERDMQKNNDLSTQSTPEEKSPATTAPAAPMQP